MLGLQLAGMTVTTLAQTSSINTADLTSKPIPTVAKVVDNREVTKARFISA